MLVICDDLEEIKEVKESSNDDGSMKTLDNWKYSDDSVSLSDSSGDIQIRGYGNFKWNQMLSNWNHKRVKISYYFSYYKID